MRLVAGLGNHPPQYRGTRHNVGFELLERYVCENDLGNWKKKWKGEYVKKGSGDDTVIFLRPFTLMNLSGDSIREVASYFSIDVEDILVIYDDIDIDLGELKISNNKGTGGHNGISDIISKVGRDFIRLRIGIRNNLVNHKKRKDFVLSSFAREEKEVLSCDLYPIAEEIIDLFCRGDIVKAMNKWNRRKKHGS